LDKKFIMKQIEKKIDDIYGPLLFSFASVQLIKQFDKIIKSSGAKYITYCKISLFKNTVINIGILFDRTRGTGSFYKLNSCKCLLLFPHPKKQKGSTKIVGKI